MKALIFNSGLGSRMGELTKDNPKSMVKLTYGECIFERQIRLLKENGIKDIIVTTGPYEEQLIGISEKEEYQDLNFKFINNPKYQETNYIYSMYLAKDSLDDDFLILHGDLVFSSNLIKDVLNDERINLITINKNKPLPPKDFKGRIINNNLREVSVNIFDDNCYALQPVYKLSKEYVAKWLEKIEEFINNGEVKVYADNALNTILENLQIEIFDYDNYYVDEIDNIDDYNRVCKEILEYEREYNL